MSFIVIEQVSPKPAELQSIVAINFVSDKAVTDFVATLVEPKSPRQTLPEQVK